jgi:FtsH-binding integral membrane protein
MTEGRAGTPMQSQQTFGSSVLALIFFALAAYAIAGSDKRWQTFGFILLSALLGLGIGAVVGVATGNEEKGATLAKLLLEAFGVTVSALQIVDNRRRRKTY